MFRSAVRKHREAGDKSGEVTALTGLCESLRAQGFIMETIGPLKRAIRLYEECNDVRGAGFALTNLGSASAFGRSGRPTSVRSAA